MELDATGPRFLGLELGTAVAAPAFRLLACCRVKEVLAPWSWISSLQGTLLREMMLRYAPVVIGECVREMLSIMLDANGDAESKASAITDAEEVVNAKQSSRS